MNRDSHRLQRCAPARATDAFAGRRAESGAVRGTDQLALFEQKPAGRPVQPTAGMRADVQESRHLIADTGKDKTLRLAIDRRIDCLGAAVGDLRQGN